MSRYFFIIFIFSSFLASANTIVVDQHGLVNTLKQGIKMAQHGDTVLLKKGLYKEGNIIINKSIHLIGIDTPILDGENEHEILTISGKGIFISGIQFQNSGSSSMNDFASIHAVDASHFIIENNTIINSFFGIHIANAHTGIIRNNTIKGNPKNEQNTGNGIHLWQCTNMVIRDNHVEGHRDGIYFEFVTHSSIKNNFSTHNIRYGLHFMFSNNDAYIGNTFRNNGAGVAVMYSQKVIMVKNNFDQNWGSNAYGILLKDISDGQVIGNVFHQNTVGIFLDGTNRMEVHKNTFTSNGWSMKVQANCDENTFHHNNFMNNTFDIATNGTRMHNEFYDNYWDKYEGYDMNKDGVGDVAYHPVSLYSMIIEQNPNSLMLMRSFMVTLLDKAEKAIPSLIPENFADQSPRMKALKL